MMTLHPALKTILRELPYVSHAKRAQHLAALTEGLRIHGGLTVSHKGVYTTLDIPQCKLFLKKFAAHV